MTKINLNQPSSIPQPLSLPAEGFSGVAKAVMVIAAAFFVAFVAIVYSRWSQPVSDDTKRNDDRTDIPEAPELTKPTPQQSMDQETTLLKGGLKICANMQVPEELVGAVADLNAKTDAFTDEEKGQAKTVLAQLKNQFSTRVHLDPELMNLIQPKMDELKPQPIPGSSAEIMGDQDVAYNESLRMDDEKETLALYNKGKESFQQKLQDKKEALEKRLKAFGIEECKKFGKGKKSISERSIARWDQLHQKLHIATSDNLFNLINRIHNHDQLTFLEDFDYSLPPPLEENAFQELTKEYEEVQKLQETLTKALMWPRLLAYYNVHKNEEGFAANLLELLKSSSQPLLPLEDDQRKD